MINKPKKKRNPHSQKLFYSTPTQRLKAIKELKDNIKYYNDEIKRLESLIKNLKRNISDTEEMLDVL